MKKSILPLIVFTTITGAAIAQEMKITEPSTISKMMEDSELKYAVNIVASAATSKTNDEVIGDNLYYSEDSSGIMVVRKLELNDDQAQIIKEAKIQAEGENYKEAINSYHQIMKSEAAYAPIYAEIGWSYLGLANVDSCVWYLDKSVELNYNYYKGHYYYALLHFFVKNYEKAMFEMTIAHVLDRNNAVVKFKTIEYLAKKKLKFIDFNFTPEYEISYGEEETININTTAGYYWYSMYRAVWLYEPGYKEERNVSNVEMSPWAEKESLFGLYLIATSKVKELKGLVKAMGKQPEIKALKKAVDGGYITEYGIYESILPKYPSYVFAMKKDDILTTAAYVLSVRGGYKFK